MSFIKNYCHLIKELFLYACIQKTSTGTFHVLHVVDVMITKTTVSVLLEHADRVCIQQVLLIWNDNFTIGKV